MEDIMTLAGKCEFCPDPAPCRQASSLDIPYGELFFLVSEEREEDAARQLRNVTPFGALLSIWGDRAAAAACPSMSDKELETLLARLAEAHGSHFYGVSAPAEENGRKIAVIGSGPAGLHAAYTLRELAYQVTVLEAAPLIGVTLLGVPALESSSAAPEAFPAIPEPVRAATVEMLEKHGIVFRTSCPQGMSELKVLLEEYDAVICASGKAAVLPAGADYRVQGKLFAAGTCVKNQKVQTALQAMASGRKAAYAVHGWLEGGSGE